MTQNKLDRCIEQMKHLHKSGIINIKWGLIPKVAEAIIDEELDHVKVYTKHNIKDLEVKSYDFTIMRIMVKNNVYGNYKVLCHAIALETVISNSEIMSTGKQINEYIDKLKDTLIDNNIVADIRKNAKSELSNMLEY